MTDTKPLRVGMELTYPPFETKDAQGNPDGVGVKLAEALARDLGRPLKIVDGTMCAAWESGRQARTAMVARGC